MRPSQVLDLMETLANISPASPHRGGLLLSKKDAETTREVYQQWLLLLVDLGYLPPDELKRTGHRLLSDMLKVDVLDLINSLTECLMLVRAQTDNGFKAHCNKVSSHLFSLLSEDRDKYLAGDVFAAKRLIQLFSYMSRLTLQDIDLSQSLLEGYLQVEAEMPQFEATPFLKTLNKIIQGWFGSYVPEEIAPSHGPGGVSGHGRCSLEVKYKDLTSDQLLEYAFGKPNWIVGPIHSNMDRISQTIFVPKSYKTFRTISMEPSTLQYFQQGVWRTIERQVQHSWYLRNHIGFREQERNQRLAKLGSIGRNYATLDLSSASDSVSYSLVKQLFSGTWMLRYLVACRSKRTWLPDGSIIALKKFAPMGSALCFPVETIIFAAICEQVTRNHRVSGDYSVFGDDIIVPTQCVEMTIRILQSLGFRVNHEKSYFSQQCWFRESCGAEYCDGFDVTPMRVSRKYASSDQDVRLSKLMALANTAYKYQYRNLRGFFLRKLRQSGFKCVFGPTQVLGDNVTNYHTKHRFNRNYQREEVLGSIAYNSYDSDVLKACDEAIRYRHWLESTYLRSNVNMGFQSVICKPVVKLKDAWFAAPPESDYSECLRVMSE